MVHWMMGKNPMNAAQPSEFNDAMWKHWRIILFWLSILIDKTQNIISIFLSFHKLGFIYCNINNDLYTEYILYLLVMKYIW